MMSAVKEFLRAGHQFFNQFVADGIGALGFDLTGSRGVVSTAAVFQHQLTDADGRRAIND